MNPDQRSIDLNADLGEGFPHDASILQRVSSASIACGGHAGDPTTIRATLAEARRHGVLVGAHPGYADRAGFGRVEQPASTAEVERLIGSQVESLQKLAGGLDVAIAYVKPHGALYNQAQRDDEIARGVIAAVARLGLPVLGQPASVLEALARHRGVRFITEGFADRRYRDDGRLVPRSEPGAVLDDPAEMQEQIMRLIDQGIMTICIHGDDPNVLNRLETVASILSARGIAIDRFAT